MSDEQPKIGRPKTGINPVLSVSISSDLQRRVDASAVRAFESRPVTVRRLLEVALRAEDGEART